MTGALLFQICLMANFILIYMSFTTKTVCAIFCLCYHYNANKILQQEITVTVLLLAHLSRRLIGELIVYQWSGVRRRRRRRPSSVVRRPQYSNIFFSETDWPIKAKFYVEPPWVGGTIFCSRHLGHMTKMAATPIYGKNP